MTNRVIPLQDLAQRISHQQAELERLRREYEARQTRLSALARRKEQLKVQLQQVEAEMQGLGHGNKAVSAPTTAAPVKMAPAKPVAAKTVAKKPAPPKPKAAPAKVAPSKPQAKATERVSLPKLLIQIVSKVTKPISLKELTQEVLRMKYPTTSSDFSSIVDTRVHELVKKGILRRAKDQQGVLPAGAAVPANAAVTMKTKPAMKPAAPKPAAAPPSKSAAAPATKIAGSEQTLPGLITMILAKSAETLSARQLSEKVLATGYKSTSKNFPNVIWAAIAKMNTVENVPGKGYRLKKAKMAVK